MTLPLIFSDEVATAKAENRATVALESTIITHGMPYPSNLETALAVEGEIRDAGAVPATIIVKAGKIHVGMTHAELEDLSQTSGAAKLSRADLAFAMAQGITGSTTVAATMIAARLAGIEVFATGGIGGVHRGAENSFDISADLEELGQTAVTVVAAGPKAILDLKKTLEVLETKGVSVISYRQDNLPAFWSRDSGLKAPLRADDADAIAKAHRIRTVLQIPGGQLVANPIPQKHEIPASTLTPHIEQSLREADEKGILAKDVTPFLLQRIYELTNGASLTANIALIRNNARLAAEIALSLQKIDIAEQRAGT